MEQSLAFPWVGIGVGAIYSMTMKSLPKDCNPESRAPSHCWHVAVAVHAATTSEKYDDWVRARKPIVRRSPTGWFAGRLFSGGSPERGGYPGQGDRGGAAKARSSARRCNRPLRGAA